MKVRHCYRVAYVHLWLCLLLSIGAIQSKLCASDPKTVQGSYLDFVLILSQMGYQTHMERGFTPFVFAIPPKGLKVNSPEDFIRRTLSNQKYAYQVNGKTVFLCDEEFEGLDQKNPLNREIVSLDIKNKILEEVIGQLAHSANAELHLLRNDKVTDKRFDVNLSRLTVGDALTKLAEISGSGSWIATMSDKLPNSTGYCVLIQIQ